MSASSILVISKNNYNDKEKAREIFMLNKKDLIAMIAEREGTTKKAAAGMLDAVTGAIKDVMKANKSVQIVGFGKFTSEYKEAQKRVFGVTGEIIEVPAHYAHKAKLSASIAD